MTDKIIELLKSHFSTIGSATSPKSVSGVDEKPQRASVATEDDRAKQNSTRDKGSQPSVVTPRPLKKEDVLFEGTDMCNKYIPKDKVLGLVEWLKQEDHKIITRLMDLLTPVGFQKEVIELINELGKSRDEGVKAIKDEVTK